MECLLSSGVGALGAGFDYVSPTTFETSYDVDGYSNIQYHLPADMLPFGIGLKVGYVPNMSATTLLSAKESDTTITSQATGRNLTMGQLSVAPIDGLSIKGDVAQINANWVQFLTEEGISANISAKYTMGPISVGYAEGGYSTSRS